MAKLASAIALLAGVSIMAICYQPENMSKTIIELPVEMTIGSDLACERAMDFMRDYFNANPHIAEVEFSNTGWIPLGNPLTRKNFEWLDGIGEFMPISSSK